MNSDYLPFTRPDIDEETIAGVVEVLALTPKLGDERTMYGLRCSDPRKR